MRMSLPSPVHLTYCLNIHPGESVPEILDAVDRHVARIKARVSPDRPFGLGLRLGAAAVSALRDAAGERDRFARIFKERNLYALTVNGFPFGAFHGTRVKERVYEPDWRSPERTAYTEGIAAILCDWMRAAGAPETGSISTVPVGYGPRFATADDRRAAARELARAAAGLGRLREERGVEIHLGLEPEPDCYVETVAGAVRFLQDELFAHGSESMSSATGRPKAACEEILRRHVGVCLDTCHLAVVGEDLTGAMDLLESEGVRLSKIQISAALRARNSAETRRRLSAFADPVYFHQTRARAGGRETGRWPDLSPALQALEAFPDDGEILSHFHVPLFWPGDGVLGTTSDTLVPEFWSRLSRGACEHLEVETYTFGVLPPDLAPRDVADSVSRELEWCLARLAC